MFINKPHADVRIQFLRPTGEHRARAVQRWRAHDPELQRRYRLYKRLEAALALPAGPQRLEALHKAHRELRSN